MASISETPTDSKKIFSSYLQQSSLTEKTADFVKVTAFFATVAVISLGFAIFGKQAHLTWDNRVILYISAAALAAIALGTSCGLIYFYRLKKEGEKQLSIEHFFECLIEESNNSWEANLSYSKPQTNFNGLLSAIGDRELHLIFMVVPALEKTAGFKNLKMKEINFSQVRNLEKLNADHLRFALAMSLNNHQEKILSHLMSIDLKSVTTIYKSISLEALGALKKLATEKLKMINEDSETHATHFKQKVRDAFGRGNNNSKFDKLLEKLKAIAGDDPEINSEIKLFETNLNKNQ